MNKVEKNQFDIQIAPRELKEQTVDAQNAEMLRRLSTTTLGPRRFTRPKPKETGE